MDFGGLFNSPGLGVIEADNLYCLADVQLHKQGYTHT